MDRSDPLNPRQMDVLNRIAAGDDASLDPGAKRSARALQDRGLLTISRCDGVWRAEVTDAGRFYLDHGHHPDRRQPSHDAPAAGSQNSEPRPRQPPKTTARVAAERRRAANELVATLKDKRRIDIVKPDEDAIAHWRKVVDFAKRHGMVPAGHSISKFRMHNGDLRIELAEGLYPNTKRQPALHIHVPDVVERLHPLLAHLSDPAAVLGVSKDQVPRALRIVHTVLTESEQRGYSARWAEDTDLGVEIGTMELRLFVTLSEERDKRDVLPTPEQLAERKVYSWQRVQPEERIVPSGRLRLEISTSKARWDRDQWWADRKRWRLEDKIGEVMAAIDNRVDQERERLAEEERVRRQRQHDWEAAMTHARQRFHDDRRIHELTEQLTALDSARRIRDYCAALDAATSADDVAQRQWQQWCYAYADRIDPTKNSPTGPEEIEPEPHDLKPYLGRWSPYGP